MKIDNAEIIAKLRDITSKKERFLLKKIIINVQKIAKTTDKILPKKATKTIINERKTAFKILESLKKIQENRSERQLEKMIFAAKDVTLESNKCTEKAYFSNMIS